MIATPTGSNVALTRRSLVLLTALACSCRTVNAHVGTPMQTAIHTAVHTAVHTATPEAADYLHPACFAGPGRAGEFGGPSSPAVALKSGPWLVLDSAGSVDEPRLSAATVRPVTFRRGMVVSRPDSLHAIIGRWSWAGADSILFEEQSIIPAAQWHLVVTPPGLQGYGIMVGDLIARRLDGTSGGVISRWPTQLRRMNCEGVPWR